MLRSRALFTTEWSSPKARSHKERVQAMSDEYNHLNESAREALKLSIEERIARIRAARWIGYTRAREILDQLEDLLTHPKKHRMPNLLISGATHNTKPMR